MASSAQPGDVWFIDMIVFTLSTRWEGARDSHRVHERGVVVVEPGLYFVGLPFQYAVSSDVLPDVGRDAEYVAKHIARNLTSREPNYRSLVHAARGV